jgi:hypothetical protein
MRHFPISRAWQQAPTPHSIVGGTRLHLLGQPIEGIQPMQYEQPGMRYRDLLRLAQSGVMSSAEYERYSQPLRLYTTLSDGFGRPITWPMVKLAAEAVNPLLIPGKTLSDEACREMLLHLRKQNRDTLAPPHDSLGRPLAPNGIL